MVDVVVVCSGDRLHTVSGWERTCALPVGSGMVAVKCARADNNDSLDREFSCYC